MARLFKKGDKVRIKTDPKSGDYRDCLSLCGVMEYAGQEFVVVDYTDGGGKSGYGYRLRDNPYWWNEELLVPAVAFDEYVPPNDGAYDMFLAILK